MQANKITAPGLTGNQLKILALITMTIDHVGAYLFPYVLWLRIVGRLALPIFAFMIAEGCRHTRSKARYLGTVALVGAVCQVVYFVFMQSVRQCIMITFSFSLVIIFAMEWAKNQRKMITWLVPVLAFGAAIFVCQHLPGLLRGTDYGVDYDIWGVLLPVFFYIGRNKWEKLLLGAVGLVLISLHQPWLQWYGLLALLPLALYNGQRGQRKLKYLFYLYYPLHLAAIYAVGMILPYLRQLFER